MESGEPEMYIDIQRNVFEVIINVGISLLF